MFPNDHAQPSLSQVIREVERLEAGAGELPRIRLAFLRNITVDMVVPYLKHALFGLGMRAEVTMTDYGTVLQEALNPNSALYAERPEIIVLCLNLEALAEDLALGFVGMPKEQRAQEEQRVLDFVNKVLEALRTQTNVPVLLHNFETPGYPAFGILDSQREDLQLATVRRLNAALPGVAARIEACYVVDADLVQTRLGRERYYDPRTWQVARAPHSRDACRALADEYARFVAALKGRNKKCLVLDCDNTLWGGVIGEDGLNGIRIGQTYPGSCFRDFQKAVLDLYNRGVILAVCSKNEEADVLRVFEEHPDMVLKAEHFACMKINWQDKAGNLRQVAAELNIGLDSLVFVDDSEFEINLVRQMVPEVDSLLLPKDPTGYPDLIRSYGRFDALAYSEEDRNRNRMYRAEVQRKQARGDFEVTDLEQYYRYLEMELAVADVDQYSMPRVSQLTQRTNQFNLTTRRYSESDIAAFVADTGARVLALRLNDRFGDMGIVGVVIVRVDQDEALLDSFMLSCRVIGRGVEDALLTAGLAAARENGAKRALGLYAPTPKNAQVKDFYPNQGFSPDGDEQGAQRFVLDLTDWNPAYSAFFKRITINGKGVDDAC